jgi:hypothetical protein
MNRSHKKIVFKCEWCGRVLPAKKLYNWLGWRNMVGPICNGCKKDYEKASEEKGEV